MIRKVDGMCYSFVVKEEKKGREDSEKKRKGDGKDVMAADVLVMWVLVHGKPILRMLPHLQQVKRGRKKNGVVQDKYKETRSQFGYTIL